jgi:hypothetical protein
MEIFIFKVRKLTSRTVEKTLKIRKPLKITTFSGEIKVNFSHPLGFSVLASPHS